MTTQRREDETMLFHWEESATTKTAPFRRNPLGAGGHRRFKRRRQAPRRLCPALLRPVTMKRRRLRPRFQTSVAAPHFAPATRRPLRAALETSATGC